MSGRSAIRIRVRAEQDIADIYAYYSLRSETLADQFLEHVQHHFKLLERFPPIGHKCRFKSPKLKHVRFIPLMRPFSRYMLSYEQSAQQVTILSILHGRRNLLPLMKRLEPS